MNLQRGLNANLGKLSYNVRKYIVVGSAVKETKILTINNYKNDKTRI